MEIVGNLDANGGGRLIHHVNVHVSVRVTVLPHLYSVAGNVSEIVKIAGKVASGWAMGREISIGLVPDCRGGAIMLNTFGNVTHR